MTIGKDRLDNILRRLWSYSRFTSFFYQSAELSPTAEIPTLALSANTGRMVLYYNTEFSDNIPEDQLVGLLVHEMMHVILNHDHRAQSGQDPQLINLAQDMVINSFLATNADSFFSRRGEYVSYTERGQQINDPPQLVLPNGVAYLPDSYAEETGDNDPTFEKVYRWLSNRPDNEIEVGSRFYPLPIPGKGETAEMISKEKGDPASNNTGNIDTTGALSLVDAKGEASPAGVHLLTGDDSIRDLQAVKQRVLSLAGSDSVCSRERIFTDIAGFVTGVNKVNGKSWKGMIKSIVDYSAQSTEWRYTSSRFNRRYFAEGVYSPARTFADKQAITVAVDVSGSIVSNPGELETAFGVIEQLLVKYRVNLLCLDENLFSPSKTVAKPDTGEKNVTPHRYKKGDWRLLKTGSSGATLFAPLFNRYMKGHREMLIVITDGYIFDTERLKKYTPTLWLIGSGRSEPFSPPFGRAVKIET
jgi:predicted metal-dependent peptidase